jgi:hypothetical protein
MEKEADKPFAKSLVLARVEVRKRRPDLAKAERAA